ncbi:MAG: YjbH domain-containing protein, partial [Rhizomicrobium sp.]
GRHAWLAFSQDSYRLRPVAIGRAARIVAQDSPPEVELITIDLLNDGLSVASVTLLRHDLERAVAAAGSPEEIWAHTTLKGGDPLRPPGIVNDAPYPSFNWSLNPQMRQELGGPDNFLIYQIYAALSGTLRIAPGQSFDGELGANLFNNLNALHQVSDSVLPHVRSDINDYLKEGKTGIFRLESDTFFNIAPNLYGRVSAGLLEDMFAGVDGEVLYRPYDRPWAVGLDLNHVVQRGYHELFGVRPYQVTTGQVTLYDKLPFYNLEAALRVGRYLAGDKGFTFELSREFAGGIRAGVFFTRTNVSAAQFGEGAFDKGFMISIPIELFFGQPSTTTTSFVYRPLTRDGGQMLDISKPLYPETDGYDPATLSRMWPHLLD